MGLFLILIWYSFVYLGKQGWRSGESARLPPIWPGFNSRSQCQIWVEFVVGSRPCSGRFFSGYSGFPLSSKTNISKFQFDLGGVPQFAFCAKYRWYLNLSVILFIFNYIYFCYHDRLRQNYELLKHKKQEANGVLMTLEREVADKMEETRSLNKQMNSIKPDIIKLQRSKQQYYL